MNRIISLLIFSLVITGLYGQDYHMYIGGKKIFYDVSSTKMLLKVENVDTVGIKFALQKESSLQTNSIKILSSGILLIDLKDVDKTKTLDLVKQWNIKEKVKYASPVLLDESGIEAGALTNQVLVRLKKEDDYTVLMKQVKPYNIGNVNLSEFDNRTYLMTIDNSLRKDAMQIASELYETGLFEYAEPNLIHFLQLYTNDTYFPYQWGINNTGQFGGTAGIDIKAVQAWTLVTGSSEVRIAILDSGVDLTHPDLVNRLLPGYDATGSGGNGGPIDGISHGTACAGIAAAQGNNSQGIAGVAYNCRILPVSIAGDGVWSTTESQYIANGISWVRQNNASVISMSFECIEINTLNTQIEIAATTGRNNLGCVLVAASGNSNSSTVGYPARNPNIIAVGAISQCGQRKSYTSCDGEYGWGSNYGTNLDVVAPGVKIYTTAIQGSGDDASGNYFNSFNGTSSACPHVSGIAALILSRNPYLTMQQVHSIIGRTAQRIGGYTYQTTSGHPYGTWNNEMGYGLVNAYTAAQSACTTPVYITNRTISSSETVNSCSNVYIENVNVISGANLNVYTSKNVYISASVSSGASLNVNTSGDVFISGPFSVSSGSFSRR
jgi:subtilisin family serine protease